MSHEWHDNRTEAEALFEKGQRHLDAGRLLLAGECFRKASELAPDFIEAHLQLAGFYLETDEPDKAVSLLRRTVRLDSQNPDAWGMLGEACLANGRPAMAVSAFKEALRLRPFDAESHAHLGRASALADRPEEAEEAFRQALALDEECVPAHIGIARLAYDRSDFTACLASLETALRLDDTQAQPWLYRGITHLELNQPAEAEKAFLRALEQDSEDPTVYFNLGKLYRDQGRLPEATRALEQAVELAPDYLYAATALGAVYFETRQPERALKVFDEALFHHPQQADLHFNRGLSLHALGRLGEAMKAWREATRLDEGMVDAYSHLAAVLRELDRVPAAVEVCRHALSLDPGHAHAHQTMALCLESLGQFPQAIQHHMEAIAAAPKATSPLLRLADLYERLHRDDEARSLFEQVLRMDPDDEGALLSLGYMHYERDDYEAAVESFRRAYELDPCNAGVALNYARALWRCDRLEEAEAVLQPHLRSLENAWVAHVQLGQIHEGMGRLVEAEASFRRAVSLAPDSSAALETIAGFYERRQLPAQAFDAWQDLLALSPAHGLAVDRVARLGARLLRPGVAWRQLSHAVHREPVNPAGRFYLAIMAACSLQWPTAAHHYRICRSQDAALGRRLETLAAWAAGALVMVLALLILQSALLRP